MGRTPLRTAAAGGYLRASSGVHAHRKDYTTITDDLEHLITTAGAADSGHSRSPSPQGGDRDKDKDNNPNPRIQIEAECLHDAEETDYNLMEKLIERRLRRDSHNLHASLEDLVAKSIKDDSSSTTSSSSESDLSGGADQSKAAPPISKKNKRRRKKRRRNVSKRKEEKAGAPSSPTPTSQVEDLHVEDKAQE